MKEVKVKCPYCVSEEISLYGKISSGCPGGIHYEFY